MKIKEDALQAIAISMMAMNILLMLLGYIYVKQTNAQIAQAETQIVQTKSLIKVEYSRCVNEMRKVGDKCER